MNEVVPKADEAVKRTQTGMHQQTSGTWWSDSHITQVPDPELWHVPEDYLIQHPEDDRAKIDSASHLVFSNWPGRKNWPLISKKGIQFDLVHDVRTLSSFYITEFDESESRYIIKRSFNDLDHGWHEQAMEKLYRIDA